MTIDWNSTDTAVMTAVERHQDLTRRAKTAQADARAAQEHVAQLERDDRSRRTTALAQGTEDPGRDAKGIAKAQANADEMSEQASLLSEATTASHDLVLQIATERQTEWIQAAEGAVVSAEDHTRSALKSLRAAFSELNAARRDHALASNAALRKRGRDPHVNDLDTPLIARNSEPYRLAEVLAALDMLTAEQEVEQREAVAR